MEQQTEFQLMLKKFNRTVENNPPASQVKDMLTTLSDLATNSPHLNYRQKDAITERVKNYMNGTYGKNAKKEEYAAKQ